MDRPVGRRRVVLRYLWPDSPARSPLRQDDAEAVPEPGEDSAQPSPREEQREHVAGEGERHQRDLLGGLRLDEDGGGTTFDEWIEVLIRVGEARYRSVTCGLPPDDSSPPTAVCAEAVLQHVAALRSEIESLQEASRIPFPRIQFNDMSPRPGESEDDLARWK